MRILEPGQISEHVHFVGDIMMSTYLVLTRHQAVQMDAGLTTTALLLERQLKSLGFEQRPIHDIFLTHSHYDHIGAVPYLLQKFPGTRTGAHPLVSKVLASEKAVRLIRALNEEAEGLFAGQVKVPPEAKFRPFPVDITLHDGERRELDGITSITVYETPGHTRDSLAFYVLPDRLLYTGDGIGIPTETGFIQATFLSDYKAYLESLRKLQSLDVEILCLPHGGVIAGKADVENHFQRSIEETVRLRGRMETKLRKHRGDVEAVTREIAAEDYEKHRIKQPPQAFAINLRAMVALTKRDLEAQGEQF